MPENKNLINRLILSFLFSVCFANVIYPYNLKVKPDVFYFSEVPVGKSFQFRVPLLIYNESDKPTSFLLDTVKPSAINADWLAGYEEIPDTNWYGFSKPYVDVPAHSVANILMYVRIPKQEIYCNQHWVVAISIREKNADNSISNRYAYPKVYLETEKKNSLKKEPNGKAGFSPSIVLLKELKLGENKACGQFTLYNNDTADHTYTLTPTGEYAFGKNQVIFPTEGYVWLPHPEWLQIKKTVTLNTKQNKTLQIDVNIPEIDESIHSKKYESILFVEDEAKNRFFVRLLLEII